MSEETGASDESILSAFSSLAQTVNDLTMFVQSLAQSVSRSPTPLITPQQQVASSAPTVAPTPTLGLTFLGTFVSIYSGGDIGASTFNAATHVPSTAVAVIVQATLTGGGGAQGSVKVRKNSATPWIEFVLLDADAGRSSQGAGQVICPVTQAIQFDYLCNDPGTVTTYSLQLCGYFSYS